MTKKELNELADKIANLEKQLYENPESSCTIQDEMTDLIFGLNLDISDIEILDELIQEKLTCF